MSIERAGSGPRLVVVQPDPADPLFELAGWFHEAGVSWTYVRPFDGETLPDRLDADGLVVLGGDMSSLDDAGHPWLEDIRGLQRIAAEEGKPSLGICLGAQLMAQAFGGETAVGDRGLETGVVRVHWLDAAQDDELVAGLASPFPAGTMHGDTVTALPSDAVWLGAGEAYPHQAFRFGDTSWGVQFHPEIKHVNYQMWVESHHDASPESQRRLREGGLDLRCNEDEVLRGNRALAHRFAAMLHARSAMSVLGPAS